MLHINNLTYRIGARLLFDDATAVVPAGHKVGLIGRNGVGKSTLLKLITGEISPESGSVSIQTRAKLTMVSQEAPGGPETLIDTVLASNLEMSSLEAEALTATDPHRIAEIHIRLADIGAHTAPARAAEILAGLGFDDAAQQRPCSSFSGGWRMRVALASALFNQPDFLLLDEPTNYLDLEGVLWLESTLKNYPYTVLIVSHDRDLLNTAVNGILHADQGKLTFYQGNYDTFERMRRERLEQQVALKTKQDAERKHIQSFIDRFRAKASKARQAQSRMKALARMEPIAGVVEEYTVPFHFPQPEELAPPLIALDDAAVGYEEGKPILHDIDMRIDMDDRIALLGSNGNGKSTFAKLLAKRLAPMKGSISQSRKLRVGYFAQHQLDELKGGETPFEHLAEMMPDAPPMKVRARLGAFGFGADKADNKVDTLSGGEKARLLFALMSFSAPQLMILDEPTNHLDIDSRQALAQAINEYSGAVILISHDRHLLDACVDRLLIIGNGRVQTFDGDIDDYRKILFSPKADNDFSKPFEPQVSAKEARRKAAEARKQIAPLKVAAENAEKELNELMREREKYKKALANPKLYDTRDAEATKALAVFTQRVGELDLEIQHQEDAWIKAEAALEAAESANAA